MFQFQSRNKWKLKKKVSVSLFKVASASWNRITTMKTETGCLRKNCFIVTAVSIWVTQICWECLLWWAPAGMPWAGDGLTSQRGWGGKCKQKVAGQSWEGSMLQMLGAAFLLWETLLPLLKESTNLHFKSQKSWNLLERGYPVEIWQPNKQSSDEI